MRKAPLAIIVTCLVALLVFAVVTWPDNDSNTDEYVDDAAYAEFYDQSIDWSAAACQGGTLLGEASTECALVSAPKNWHDPAAGTIEVAIARPAGYDSGDKRLLLAYAGSPGTDNLENASAFVSSFDAWGSHYAIGIDPRGVGASTRLECPDELELPEQSHLSDGEPRTYDDESLAATSRAYAEKTQKCAQANEGWMEFVNTEQTARDFNLVRHVLGYRLADYYGYSYGTWLGAAIARMFPNNFDRMILSANLPWGSQSLLDAYQSRAPALQQITDRQFYPFVARNNLLYGLGTTTQEVADTVEDMRTQLANGALDGEVTPADLDQMMYAANFEFLPFVPAAKKLSDLRQRLNDPQPSAEKFEVVSETNRLSYRNSDVFDTVICADTAVSTDPLHYADKNKEIGRTMPLWGPMSLHNPCAGWDFEPALGDDFLEKPVGEVLMIHPEGDPFFSYNQIVATKEAMGAEVTMVAIDDFAGHTLAELSVDCAKNVVRDYLVDGDFPSSDVNCQSKPLSRGAATEDEVYELGNPGTEPDQIPEPVEYRERDLSAPPVDQSS